MKPNNYKIVTEPAFDQKDQKLEDDKKLKEQQKREQEKWVFKSEGPELDSSQHVVKPRKQESTIINQSISNVQNNNSISQYEKVLSKFKTKGSGHSEFQSSSSLQHSIPEVSFCKANRFQYNFDGQTDFNYSLPSTFDKSPSKGTSFGFGQKFIVPDHVLRNAKTNPAPDSYFRNDSKTSLQPQRSQNWPQSVRFAAKHEMGGAQQPAPNNYNLQHNFGQSKSKFSFGLKTKELTTFQDCVPSPNVYNQSIDYVSQNRFSGIGLGFGEKTQLGNKNDTPGPGQYNLPSVFKNNAGSIVHSRQSVV